jgi:hypothetical protein
MFNIVKRRDFMLGQDVPTKQEAEKAHDNYGGEYVVVQTTEPERRDQHPSESQRHALGKAEAEAGRMKS